MTAHSISARNIRSYLAGTGASGALVAASVVAFLTVGALFAVDGMPGDSPTSQGDSVFVGPAAPGAAAADVGAAPGAVAATPSSLPPSAVAALLAAAGPDGGLPAGAPQGPGAPTTDDGTTLIPGTTAPGTPAPAPTSAGTPSSGTLGDIVDNVGNSTGNSGLGQATGPVTGPVDQALDQTGVGDTVDQTLGGVNDATGGLLGGN